MNTKDFIVNEKALSNGMLEVELIPEVMRDSVHGCFYLQRRNELRIEELIDKLPQIPPRITKIHFEIIPSLDSIHYQSFGGIESIIYFLFLTENVEINKELIKQKVLIKIFYKKERYSLYKIPIIVVELIFLGELSERTFDFFGWNLAGVNGFLNYSSQSGDIKYIDITSKNDFENELKIPLLIGQEEFLYQDGLFKHNGYSESQLVELNHIHGIGMIELNMRQIIIDADVNFLDEIRSILPKVGGEEENNLIEDESSPLDNLPF